MKEFDHALHALSVAAERQGDEARITAILAQAAEAGIDDARLRCRRARGGSAADLDHLERLLDQGEDLPWRESALAFAQSGRSARAQRSRSRGGASRRRAAVAIRSAKRRYILGVQSRGSVASRGRPRGGCR